MMETKLFFLDSTFQFDGLRVVFHVRLLIRQAYTKIKLSLHKYLEPLSMMLPQSSE